MLSKVILQAKAVERVLLYLKHEDILRNQVVAEVPAPCRHHRRRRRRVTCSARKGSEKPVEGNGQAVKRQHPQLETKRTR